VVQDFLHASAVRLRPMSQLRLRLVACAGTAEEKATKMCECDDMRLVMKLNLTGFA